MGALPGLPFAAGTSEEVPGGLSFGPARALGGLNKGLAGDFVVVEV